MLNDSLWRDRAGFFTRLSLIVVTSMQQERLILKRTFSLLKFQSERQIIIIKVESQKTRVKRINLGFCFKYSYPRNAVIKIIKRVSD